MFGDMVTDIERKFLALRSFELEALLSEYGKQHGRSAEAYARKTYQDWKSGSVTLSGKTAERLLELLPKHLSSEERFGFVRKLRTRYFKKQSEWVRITPDQNWRTEVMQAVNKLIASSRSFSLPEALEEKATWLAGGDAQAAHRLLRAAEEEEARLRASFLDAEFKRINVLLNNLEHTKHVSHEIKLPQGDIHVTIELQQPTVMQKLFGGGNVNRNKSNALVAQEEINRSLVTRQGTGNLLDLATSELTDGQRHDLAKRIIDEKITLDVNERKADQRYGDSTRDMANTVRAVNSLENSTKSDYDVRSSYETASGETNIHVKKNNNTAIIVIAIVIGVVLFLIFAGGS